MTLSQFNKLCHLWQSRLRLLDWDISFSLHNGYDLQGVWGECRAMDTKRKAWIKIADPSTVTEADYNIEQVIIHELLHIEWWHFMPTERDSLARDEFERALDRTAWNIYQGYLTISS